MKGRWIAMAAAAMMAGTGCAEQGESLPSPSRAAQCEAMEQLEFVETMELAARRSPVMVGDTAYTLESGELTRISLSNPLEPERGKSIELPEDQGATMLQRYGERLVTIGRAVTVYELVERELRVLARSGADLADVDDAALVGDTLYLHHADGSSFVDLSRIGHSSSLEVMPMNLDLDRMWPSAERLIVGGAYGMHALESAPGQAPEIAATFAGSYVEYAIADVGTDLTFALIDEDAGLELRLLDELPSGNYRDVGRTSAKPGTIGMEVLGDELLAFRPDVVLVYDISDPSAPFEANRFEYSEHIPVREGVGQVSLQGPYMLVSSKGHVDLLSMCEPEPMRTRPDSM